MAITIKKIERWSSKKKVGKLLNAVNVAGADIRIAAIQALGATKDENAMHTLISLLKDPDKSIRASAADALGNMGNIRSLEFVRQLWVNEQDGEVREKAKQAIAKIKENTVQTEKA